MSSKLISVRSKKNRSTHSSQTQFNLHRRKLDGLCLKYDSIIQEYEQALALFHSEIKPKERSVGEFIANYLCKLLPKVKSGNHFNKQEKEILYDFMNNDLGLVIRYVPYQDIPLELKKFYKELNGQDPEESFKDMMTEIKREFECMSGMDLGELDLSNLNLDDEKDETVRKFVSSLHDALKDGSFGTKKHEKSKRELLKEKKASELEQLKNTKISTVYKRLAKELHPDLEQDLLVKAEKEEIMKQLTSAYENGDLLEILKIESAWFSKCERDVELINEETLKIYNSILKDQIKELEEKINCINFDLRYLEISDYVEHCPKTPLKGLKDATLDLKHIVREYEGRMKDLEREDFIEFLKNSVCVSSPLSEFDDLLQFIGMEDLFEEVDKPKITRRKKRRSGD